MPSISSPKEDLGTAPPQHTPASSSKVDIAPAENGKWYSCTHCQRSFTRVDHLARHVRSHTGETCYKCNICLKSFSRPDVVRRHAATHAPKPPRDDGEQQTKDSARPVSGRVSKACKACTAAKLRCQEEKPCQRCKQKGMACEILGHPERHGAPSTGPRAADHMQSTSFIATPIQPSASDNVLLEAHSQDDVQVGGWRKRNLDTMQKDECPSSPDSTEGAHPLDGSRTKAKVMPSLPDDLCTVPGNFFRPDVAHLAFFDDEDDSFMTQFWQDLPASASATFASSSGRLLVSCDGDGTTNLPTTGLDIDGDFDFGQMHPLTEALGTLGPSHPPISSPRADPIAIAHEGSQELLRTLAASLDVLRKTASFGVVSRQKTQTQLGNSYLEISEEDRATLERQFGSPASVSREKLSSRSRDQILVMVLSALPQGDPSSIVAAFPPVEVLDVLVQSFLKFIFHQMDSMLHFPTLKPNCQRPELLCSLIAAGASETQLPSVRAFGIALQDVVRVSLQRTFERVEQHETDLSLLQTCGIQAYIEFYSGRPEKKEASRALQGSLIGILRRNGLFGRSAYPLIMLDPADSDEVVEQKWHEWVQQECIKRIALHAFILDAQSSLTNHTNPLTSYHELTFPLPHHRDLWIVSSAAEWKRVYQSKFPTGGPRHSPSLYDVSIDRALMSQQLEQIDVPIAAWATLHHFWSLFWDSRRLVAWSCARSGDPTAAMNLWRHDDVCRWLTLFKLEACEWPIDPIYEVQFLTEVLSMYLHLPLEFHQLFASTDCCGDVSELMTSIKHWVRNDGSRHAVWFAGQALQISKLFPCKLLKDIHATALYHVFLTLWLYGVGTKAQETDLLAHTLLATTGPLLPVLDQDTPRVWVDCAETAEVKKYIALGRGSPALKNKHAQAVALADLEGVAELVTGILCSNYPCEPPAYTMNLLLGMKAIGGVLGPGRQSHRK